MKKVRHVLRETASFPMTSKRDSGNEAGRQIRGLR